jgi:hypothetical protein
MYYVPKWYHGTRVRTRVPYHGTRVPWYHGSIWYGTRVPWWYQYGTRVPWYQNGTTPISIEIFKYQSGIAIPYGTTIWYHGTKLVATMVAICIA